MAVETDTSSASGSLVKKLLLGGGALGLVVVVALAWWLGLLTPEPDPVSITEAAATASGEETSGATASEGVEESQAVDVTSVSLTTVEGEWSVVASDATFIGYRAIGTTGEGVGRSPGVTGTLTATENEIVAVSIVGDLTLLESDSSLRDEHLGDEGLETNIFPTSTFELTEPISIGEIPAAGVESTFSAVGELTVKDITQPVTIELQAVVVEDRFVVAGSTEVALADFEAVIGSTTEATMEFSLVFER